MDDLTLEIQSRFETYFLNQKLINRIITQSWFPTTTAHKTCYFEIATSCIKGERCSMEDIYENQIEGVDSHQKISFFGIYDGHCGGECSKFLSKQFGKGLIESIIG